MVSKACGTPEHLWSFVWLWLCAVWGEVAWHRACDSVDSASIHSPLWGSHSRLFLRGTQTTVFTLLPSRCPQGTSKTLPSVMKSFLSSSAHPPVHPGTLRTGAMRVTRPSLFKSLLSPGFCHWIMSSSFPTSTTNGFPDLNCTQTSWKAPP